VGYEEIFKNIMELTKVTKENRLLLFSISTTNHFHIYFIEENQREENSLRAFQVLYFQASLLTDK
jgi:hypothetical protein